MAEPVQIQGSDYSGKIRNPLAVIGLSIITLGIYGIFWYFFTNKELAEIGKARGTHELGTSPITSVLAVTLGVFLLFIPTLVSAYKFCTRISAGERATGTPQGMEAGLLFILWIFISPVALYIAQSNLNKVLQAQAGGGSVLPAGAAIPQPAPETPAPAPPHQP